MNPGDYIGLIMALAAPVIATVRVVRSRPRRLGFSEDLLVIQGSQDMLTSLYLTDLVKARARAGAASRAKTWSPWLAFSGLWCLEAEAVLKSDWEKKVSLEVKQKFEVKAEPWSVTVQEEGRGFAASLHGR